MVVMPLLAYHILFQRLSKPAVAPVGLGRSRRALQACTGVKIQHLSPSFTRVGLHALYLETFTLNVDAELGLLLPHVEGQVEVMELFLSGTEGDLDRHSPLRG